MLLRTKARKRNGAYVVEAAFVYPITFFLILAMVIGSMGIFRFQECSFLARLGARYGSVHGDNYWYYQRNLRPPNASPGTSANPSGYTDATSGTTYLVYQPTTTTTGPGTYTNWTDDIYGNAIYPKLMLLDPANVTCTVAWPTVALNPNMPDNGQGSQLRVTVSYQWVPEVSFWLPGLGSITYGPYTLSSRSSMPITN
jgi:hypothetical protein